MSSSGTQSDVGPSRTTTASPGRVDRGGARRRLPLVQLVVLSAIAFALMAIGSVVASRRAGTTEAIRDARERTAMLARNVVEPPLSDALLAGDEGEVARFRSLMLTVSANESIENMRLWRRDGALIYADDPALVGRTVALKEDAEEAFTSGEPQAEVSDLSAEENALDTSEGRLLEVYHPVRARDGTRLVLEVYYPYSLVSGSAQRIWVAFLPIVLAPLAILQLLQLPLGARLVRLVRRGDQERAFLLRQVTETAERERRAIVQQLHDGTCQELSGTRLALAAVARRAEDRLVDEERASLERIGADLARSLESLRSLLVEVYPPEPGVDGVERALEELAGAFRTATRAITVSVEIGSVDAERARLACRFVQEALRNVAKHAEADNVWIAAGERDGTMVFSVRDDGNGFDPEVAARSGRPGHFGLRLLDDLARQAGGRVELNTSQQPGTEIRLVLLR